MIEIKLTPTITQFKGLNIMTKRLPSRTVINGDTLYVRADLIGGDSVDLEIEVEVLNEKTTN